MKKPPGTPPPKVTKPVEDAAQQRHTADASDAPAHNRTRASRYGRGAHPHSPQEGARQ